MPQFYFRLLLFTEIDFILKNKKEKQGIQIIRKRVKEEDLPKFIV
jgi:hypothetical protein